MRTKTLLVFVTVAAAVLVGPSLGAARTEIQSETGHGTLEGRRYETLRALARHLDETARGALEGAEDAKYRASSSAARLLSSIRSFAGLAEDFHRMVENYPTRPFAVPAEVHELARRAHQVNEGIRSARALENTHGDWEAILDVLERMERLLAGDDVEVPAAHVVAALSGPRLQEFRQLAQELEASATRAHQKAKLGVGDYPGRGQQFLGELNYFAVQSSDLRSRTDAGPVEPQRIGPLVDRLLEEARKADRRMRDAEVFSSVWDDSGRTITLLQRMASLVRS